MRTASLVVASTAAACALLFAMKGNDPAPSIDRRSGDDAATIARLKASLRTANEEKSALDRELDALREGQRDLTEQLAKASRATPTKALVPLPPAPVPSKPTGDGPKTTRVRLNDHGVDEKTLTAKIASGRFFAYKAYRPFRPYRAFKAFVSGEAETRGSEKFCRRDPLDPDCLGSAASCMKEPDVDECVGTEPFCERHAASQLCTGTEVYCNQNPGRDACIGTSFWCILHKGSKECTGARFDCEATPRQDECLGTVAYCAAQSDGRLCPWDG